MILFLRKLDWLFRRRRKERELQEELKFHLEEEAEEREADGLPHEEAARAARRDFGNIAVVRENTRDVWLWAFVEQCGQDLRYAFRAMLANRMFTALAVVSLALGIGANTAIYSFMDAVLLRSLPVNDPQSLVLMNWRMKRPAGGNFSPKGPASVLHAMNGTTYDDPDNGWAGGIFPYPAFELLNKSDSVFSSVFGWMPASLNAVFREESELASAVYVTGGYFTGLGIVPSAGRIIAAADDEPDAPPVAVVSHRYCKTHSDSPADCVGQTILLNSLPVTIAGVTPPDFRGVDAPTAPQIFVPLRVSLQLETGRNSGPDMYTDQNYYWIRIMGRLRPGTTRSMAESALAIPFHQWAESTAKTEREQSNLPVLLIKNGSAGADALVHRYVKPLYILMMLVGLILAVACANIANLLLARGSARSREIAVRLSLGASRLRILRQLLTESVGLAFLGGVFGMLIAVWGIRFLTALLGSTSPQATLNWHVLAVAAALSLATGVLFGLAPAIQATRQDLVPGLKTSRAGRRPSGMRGQLTDALVVFQIAMSLLMLVAAGLFAETLANYHAVPLGYNPEHVLLLQVNAGQAGHSGVELANFYDDLRERFSAIPGVRSVSLSTESLIFSGTGLPITVGDYHSDQFCCNVMFVGPAFFSTMHIPVLLGREFDKTDRPGSPMVAIMNETFANAAFRDENPVGRHVAMARDTREMEIVGVVKDFQYGGLGRKIPPVLIVPYNQGAFMMIDRMTYEIRTEDDPLGHSKIVRGILHNADAAVPASRIMTQQQEIDRSLSQEIMFAKLCTAFAILALTIACIGLYGTVAYNVSRRTSEIGIRMALGAQRGRVIRMILKRVAASALTALALGLPLVLIASREVEAYMFGIKANDPRIISEALIILLASTVFAAFVPARRASRIDPAIALRHD